MTALINNANVRGLLGYQAGQQIAETGGIAPLGWELETLRNISVRISIVPRTGMI